MLKIKPITAKSLRRSATFTDALVTATISCCIGSMGGFCDGIESEDGEFEISATGKHKDEALANLLVKAKAEGWKDYRTSGETGWACPSCLASYVEADKDDAL